MPAILIRGLDDDLKRQLRVRAAENGRSMEEEVRQILRQALSVPFPRDVAEVATREEVAPPPRPPQGPGRVRLFGRR